MGLFDSLKKVIGDVNEVKSKIESISAAASSQSSASKPVSQKRAAPVSPAKTTDRKIIESGSQPAKMSVLRKTSFLGGENGDEYNVSFMLSGDFIEFESNCEFDPSFQYEPYSDADYTEYDESLPSIFIGPNNTVYNAAENYIKNGSSVGRDFNKIDSKYFLFRTKLEYFGQVLYAYAFASGTTQEYNMLGLTYNHDIEGTPLERKLISALDEAAETYKETRI